MLMRALLALTVATPCIACASVNESRSALISQGESSESGETDCPTNAADRGNPVWLRSYDASLISSIASDGAGNILIARSGLETSKLDALGEPMWSKPFGRLVATGANDDVYVADEHGVQRLDADGNALYAVDLGATAQIESLAVVGDAVVVSGPGLGTVRLGPSGERLWSRDFFGQIALDRGGSVVVAGALIGATDFGGGVLTSRGGSDVFVAKLDASGQHVFSRAFGDTSTEQRAESAVVDAEGNVVIAGVFDGSLDFDSGPLTLRPQACSSDAWCNTFGFVAQLDEAGTVQWSRELGPLRSVQGAAADARGDVVLSGALPGGVRPFRNSWLTALDAQGNTTWLRAEWPETGIGAGHAVAIDPCDNVLWSVSARPDLESEERAYVAKLSP